MQNPNNVHAVGAFQIEHNVISDTVPSIPFTNLVARATSIGVVGNTFNRDPDGGDVGFSLASLAWCVVRYAAERHVIRERLER